MQRLKVADPITSVVMEVVLWNRQIIVDEGLLNKTVLLKRFKKSVFKDQVNLVATFRSQIERHKYF